MPFSQKTLEEKPYNKCVTCVHIGKDCDGPNFLAMTTERWCEWCYLRKDYLDWTNAHIAELTDVSKASVDRIMSGNVKDLRNTTMQAITKALVNGSWGQYPCAMVGDSANAEIAEQCKALQTALDKLADEHREEIEEVRKAERGKIDFLQKQIAFKEHQMDMKDQLLKERYDFLKRKDKVIALLGALFGVCLLVIIAALVIDGLNPNIGFFWVK